MLHVSHARLCTRPVRGYCCQNLSGLSARDPDADCCVQPAKGEPTDHNSNVCVLCGLGGSLLCCDACPGAFHLRCLGEFSKALPAGEWLCGECCLGGRGAAPSHSCATHIARFWQKKRMVLKQVSYILLVQRL